MGASFSGNRRSSTDRISPAGGSQPVAVHQKIVPARVVARGAGLRLSQKASIPALRRAIQRVLDEPGFRTGPPPGASHRRGDTPATGRRSTGGAGNAGTCSRSLERLGDGS